jgi:hypothetical protein
VPPDQEVMNHRAGLTSPLMMASLPIFEACGLKEVGLSRGVAVMLVSPLLPQYLLKFPEIKLEISVDDTHTDIVAPRPRQRR